MGNNITNDKNYSQKERLDKMLAMSNGLTAVLIEVLSLSASYLAKTDAEIDFAIWVACHDQAIMGRGMVGFDLSELPWSTENFEAEKRFLLRVVDSAKAKQYWNLLDYEPREEMVLCSLEKFKDLIEDFSKEFISTNNFWSKTLPKPAKHKKCSLHNIYLHEEGCVICNNM
ncbi:hypothetical protein HC931_08690 [Candidatus Gracilibacteria bacterium]|nr:hypothetical protein [Candidatus Gracilibacteria bacterium]NJM85874.1 hypothetical protein [Hydrococcus sp. RU_2_2]